MTTIAYCARAQVMACDSCWSDDKGRIVNMATKIWRLPCGGLYGASGDCDDRVLAKLMQSVQTPDDLPTRKQLRSKDDVRALVVFPSGEIFQIDVAKSDNGITPVTKPFYAIGSGGPFARGAMHEGANVVRAVEIACAEDIYSRPPIHTLSLKGE